MKLKIMYGLPGSGKSHFGKSLSGILLSEDNYSRDETLMLVKEQAVLREDVIVDRLNITNEGLQEFIKVAEDSGYEEIIVYQFLENREACIHNDKLRVEKGERRNIMHGIRSWEYEEIEVSSKIPLKIIQMEVEKH